MNSTLSTVSANGKVSGAAWRSNAPALADWPGARLVNRDDRHGQYYRNEAGEVRPCASPAKAGDARPGRLSRARLLRHFRVTGTDDVVGVYAYGAEKRGKWLVIDIDNHDDGADPEVNRRYARHLYAKLTGLGFVCLLYESNGNGGFHLWVLFATPVAAVILHRFGNWLVTDHADHGFTKPPEVFPKNEGETAWGHWVRLPGRHPKRDVWSRVWTGTQWVTEAAAIAHVLSLTGSDPARIPPEAGRPAPTAKKEPRAKDDRVAGVAGGALEPWEAFNRAATAESVAALLERHGWTRDGERTDGAIEFVRPGKGQGQGANLKVVSGVPIFHVFTDAGGIPPGAHAPDAVRCHLEFHGDVKALNTQLRAEGYGSRAPVGGASKAAVDLKGLTESGYTADQGGTYQYVLTRDNEAGELQFKERRKLANFTARIVGETVNDDGAEQTREFAVSVEQLNKPARTACVPVERFGSLDWVVERFGPQYVIQAGSGKRDHLRCAIQEMSGDEIPTTTIYRHTGWREIGGQWRYLHGGGAIPVVPTVPVSTGVEVRLDGTADGFRLQPAEGDQLRQAVRTSLNLLNGLAPDAIVFPLLATVYRAALGAPDYALWLSGVTGAQKSELAALAQQHYGAAMTRDRLPGNWSSTDNALEGLAFTVKDALLVIDDFAPPSSRADADRQHRTAERLIRAQGNHSGRQRMRADGTLRPPKPPRGLILATGEDVPRGHSIAARLAVVEVRRGDVNLARLSECQRDAAAGLYASAMAGFVAWLAPRYASVRAGLDAERTQLRDGFVGRYPHARTPDTVANLLIGLRYLLRFAQRTGAIDREERGCLRDRGRRPSNCWPRARRSPSVLPIRWHGSRRCWRRSLAAGAVTLLGRTATSPSFPPSRGGGPGALLLPAPMNRSSTITAAVARSVGLTPRTCTLIRTPPTPLWWNWRAIRGRPIPSRSRPCSGG